MIPTKLHIYRTREGTVVPDHAIFVWNGSELTFKDEKTMKSEVASVFGYALEDHELVFIPGCYCYGSFKLPPTDFQTKSEVCVWSKDGEEFPSPTVYIWMPSSNKKLLCQQYVPALVMRVKIDFEGRL